MVLYPKDPHYKIFDIAPATAIMIGISPPEGKKKGRLPFFTRMDSQTRLPRLRHTRTGPLGVLTRELIT